MLLHRVLQLCVVEPQPTKTGVVDTHRILVDTNAYTSLQHCNMWRKATL